MPTHSLKTLTLIVLCGALLLTQKSRVIGVNPTHSVWLRHTDSLSMIDVAAKREVRTEPLLARFDSTQQVIQDAIISKDHQTIYLLLESKDMSYPWGRGLVIKKSLDTGSEQILCGSEANILTRIDPNPEKTFSVLSGRRHIRAFYPGIIRTLDLQKGICSEIMVPGISPQIGGSRIQWYDEYSITAYNGDGITFSDLRTMTATILATGRLASKNVSYGTLRVPNTRQLLVKYTPPGVDIFDSNPVVQLRLLDVDRKTFTDLTQPINPNLELISFSPDGKYLLGCIIEFCEVIDFKTGQVRVGFIGRQPPFDMYPNRNEYWLPDSSLLYAIKQGTPTQILEINPAQGTLRVVMDVQEDTWFIP
jgi:hypothetical protein